MSVLIQVFHLEEKQKNFLNQIESKNPGTKENIMESFKKNDFKYQNSKKIILMNVKKCGEPSSGLICKACEIIDLIDSS